MIECEDSIVFVLIDEVESLAAARSSAMNGAEPSDSIRAVNALLTQIDKLRQYQNVLVLTTSNISESIDLAFVDRADLKQYIGNPTEKARYFILDSCIKELLTKGFLYVVDTQKNKAQNQEDYLMEYDKIKQFVECDLDLNLSQNQNISPIPFAAKTSPFGKRDLVMNQSQKCSQKLYEIVKSMEGFSGRTLRKLPFITSVYHIESSNCSLMQFLESLEEMAVTEMEQRDKLRTSKAMDG